MQSLEKLKTHFALFIISFMIFSCGRPSHDGPALVKIQLPNQFNNSSTSSHYISKLLSFTNSTEKAVTAASLADNQNWLPVLPTGYGDEFSLNCFFVFVSGPEQKGNFCAKGTPNSANIEFGDIDGPSFLGSELEIYVLPGTDRVFSVYGMHSPSKADCRKLYDPEFKRSQLTRPYLVGKSSPSNIFANGENIITIAKNTFDSLNFLDTCRFKDSSVADSTVPLIPGQIDLSIANNMTGNASETNICVPLKISMLDATGVKKIASPYEFNFGLTKGSGPSYTTLVTYNNAFDCIKDVSGTNGATSFSTYQKAETEVWAKGDPSFSSLDFNTATQANIGAGVQLSVQPRINYPNQLSRRASLLLPSEILNDVCYPLTLGVVDFSLALTTAIDTNKGFSLSASSDNTTARQVSFFSSPGCSGGSNIGNTSAVISADLTTVYWSRKVYFQTSGYTLGEKINFSAQHFTLANIFFSDTQQTKRIQDNTDTEVVKLKLIGPRNLLRWSCHGPYRLQFTNLAGAAVNLPSPAKVSFLYDKEVTLSNGTKVQSTQLYKRVDETKTPCQSSQPEDKIEPDTAFDISVADSHFEFYVYIDNSIDNTEPTSLARYITVVDKNPTNYVEDRLLLKIHDYTSLTSKPAVPAPALRDFN